MLKERWIWIAGGAVLVILMGSLLFHGKKKAPEPTPPGRSSAQELFNKAMNLKKNSEWAKAKDAYQLIITQYPDYEGVETVSKELEELNMQMITTNIQCPKAIVHKVEPGDSLAKIAKKYETTVELIKKRNNLSSDTIRVGQPLSIYLANFNMLVDKSQNILILKDADQVVKVYSVSTGANNSTPVGDFKITTKLVDPVWFKSGAIIPPESPQNVLGSRWMGFDLAGYGIHGTIDPDQIGQQVTAGCVRMRNAEVEELYDILPIGTKVTIID